MKRKPLSKRTRFEILKRDNWRCHYCGAGPMQGALHVDHVKPVAEGGTDDAHNLVTACEGCNLGKAFIPLEQRKYVPGKVTAADEDHAEQIRAWLEVQRGVSEARDEVLDALELDWHKRMSTEPRALRGSLRKVAHEFAPQHVLHAFDIVADKDIRGGNEQLRYFHGVLRNWRERGTPDLEPPREKVAPPEHPYQRHIDRARRAVARAIEEIGANPDGFADLDAKRQHVKAAFFRAAWAPKWALCAPSTNSSSWRSNTHGARGLWLTFEDDGGVRVGADDDLNPYELAYRSLHNDVCMASGSSDGPEQALADIQETALEVHLWLTLFTEEEQFAEALEHFRSKPTESSILAHWEVE